MNKKYSSSKRQYENGYWEKITYWINQLQQASYDNDIRGVDHAHRKLDYFIGRQWNLTDFYPNVPVRPA